MADPLRKAKEMAAYNNQLYKQNWQTNANFNAKEAQKNRDWQERMANSAHQREIADLKAAGLNPVLSVTGGNGAPTGSGSAASAQQAPVDTSLPMAVIDMATAQLNNATRLQEMAMQTQSAQQIASNQIASDIFRHITPGGSTIVGQGNYLLDNFWSIISKPYRIFGDADSLINDLLFGKTTTSGSRVGSNKAQVQDIDRMIDGLGKGYTGRKLKEYSSVNNKSYSNRTQRRGLVGTTIPKAFGSLLKKAVGTSAFIPTFIRTALGIKYDLKRFKKR